MFDRLLAFLLLLALSPLLLTLAVLIRRSGGPLLYRHLRLGRQGGRGALSYAERVKLNGWYVRNWSLWLDIIILIKTLPVLLSRHGAF